MGSIKCILGCLVMVTYLHGQTITEQIEAIQRAAPSERVEMMNRLKVQIASMNEAERMEALDALQSGGPRKMMQFHQNNNVKGNSGEFRYRLNNTQGNSAHRQQGRP